VAPAEIRPNGQEAVVEWIQDHWRLFWLIPAGCFGAAVALGLIEMRRRAINTTDK
jgi:hypothetical protein